MIIRNFAVTQNAVINTVMSYQICRQVLNKYYITSLNTSCLTMEYIFIFVKAIYTMLVTDIITCLTDEKKHPFVLWSWNSHK